MHRKSVRVDPSRNTPPLCTGPTTSYTQAHTPSSCDLVSCRLHLHLPRTPRPRKFGHSTRRLQSTVAPKARHTVRARDRPHGSVCSVSSLHTEVGFSLPLTHPSHPQPHSILSTQFFSRSWAQDCASSDKHRSLLQLKDKSCSPIAGLRDLSKSPQGPSPMAYRTQS